MPASPCVDSFFDPATSTVSHVVHAGPSSEAAIVDSVLDFDPKSGRTSRDSADKLIAFIGERGLKVAWHLETHVHADHLSAAPYLKQKLGGRIGIGSRIVEVQERFGKVFNFGLDVSGTGAEFDRLFEDGDTFAIGELHGTVIHVPGHTPADVAYVIGDAAFIGDTLFAPDLGSARADFPGGDAHALYRSARRLLALPPETRLYLCHDYPPEGRGLMTCATVGEQRAKNKHLADGIDEDSFVEMRQKRDATLSLPVLMLPSVQVNMRAGHLPPREDNGIAYLKIPIDVL
ncbi:MAG TPA: MBL fold metallo-hydrolase [Xanthobacteraceae bacterium]|nr:MBL fold metallo-hydrolase [Xanthobacteraceae bacterium]